MGKIVLDSRDANCSVRLPSYRAAAGASRGLAVSTAVIWTMGRAEDVGPLSLDTLEAGKELKAMQGHRWHCVRALQWRAFVINGDSAIVTVIHLVTDSVMATATAAGGSSARPVSSGTLSVIQEQDADIFVALGAVPIAPPARTTSIDAAIGVYSVSATIDTRESARSRKWP